MYMRCVFAVRRVLLLGWCPVTVCAVVMIVVVVACRRTVLVRSVAAVGVAVTVTVRQDHFTDTVTRAVFMGMRRRRRHDAKLRQGDCQNRR